VVGEEEYQVSVKSKIASNSTSFSLLLVHLLVNLLKSNH